MVDEETLEITALILSITEILAKMVIWVTKKLLRIFFKPGKHSKK